MVLKPQFYFYLQQQGHQISSGRWRAGLTPLCSFVQLLPARPVESSSGDSCNVWLQWALLGTDRTCSSSSQTCASDTRWVHACSPRTWQGVGKVICHLLRESPYGQSAVPLQCLLPQLTGDGSHDSAGRPQQRWMHVWEVWASRESYSRSHGTSLPRCLCIACVPSVEPACSFCLFRSVAL